MAPDFVRALLVCDEGCTEVENCLVTSGWSISKVRDGDMAVSRVRREKFDSAVLVSTGRAMDLIETVLNLRDITQQMEIFIIAGVGADQEGAVGTLAQSLPHTMVIQLERLQEVLQTTKSQHCG